MPFYEYVCANCGKATTLLQKISDAPATDCPQCGASALTKQISAAGFRLKGSGWYETDFKSDNKKNLAGEGSSGAPASTASTASSADKPAEKAASSTDAKPAAASAATPAAPAPKPASTTES